MNSSLSIFSFVACAFGVIAKANVMKLLPYIFLTSFIFLGHIFGPLIHVGNFVMVLGSNRVSFSSIRISSFPSTVCWRDRPCSIRWSWHPCREPQGRARAAPFWALCAAPLICLPAFRPLQHCLDYCSFAVSLEIRKCKSCNVGILFQDYFGQSLDETLKLAFYFSEYSKVCYFSISVWQFQCLLFLLLPVIPVTSVSLPCMPDLQLCPGVCIWADIYRSNSRPQMLPSS